jgi:MFS family permease
MAERRFFLLMAFVGGVAILGSTMSKTPVLPLFAAQLGATPAEIGWVVIASTLPGILVSFPVGVLADTFGKRPVIIGSLVVFATAPFLYLGVSTALELMAVRFYHGFATAIFGTVAAAAIAERYPQQRAAMLSTFSSATLIGRSIAPFLGGFLISVASFHSVYIACGISGVLALLAGLALPRDAKSAHPPASGAGLRTPSFFESLRLVLSNRGIVLTSVLEAAQLLVFGAVEAFLALYAASVGITAWQIGVILGAQLLGIVVIKPAMGALSDRWGRRAVILPGLLVGALSVGLMPFVQEMFALCFLSIAFGVGYAMVTSSTAALVADLTRAGKFGASMGVLRTVMDVGQTIGPVATGFMVMWFGYGIAFVVLSAVLLSATLVFVAAPQLGK